jgi:hypothetical protein
MLLFPAYVPVGFMPASGTPFLRTVPRRIAHVEVEAHGGASPSFGYSYSLRELSVRQRFGYSPLPHLDGVKALPPVNLDSPP